jgi:hypothetical protein
MVDEPEVGELSETGQELEVITVQKAIGQIQQ